MLEVGVAEQCIYHVRATRGFFPVILLSEVSALAMLAAPADGSVWAPDGPPRRRPPRASVTEIHSPARMRLRPSYTRRKHVPLARPLRRRSCSLRLWCKESAADEVDYHLSDFGWFEVIGSDDAAG